MNPRQQRSAARRLTHRSRSASVIVALVGVVVGGGWIATEAVVAALGYPALLLSPSAMVEILRDQPAVTGAVAVALALVGIVLIVLALSPARKARHVLADERSVVVIDDVVLAGALSRAAASAARVPGAQVRTALGRRSAQVSVTPLSGFPLAVDAITAAVDETLTAAQPSRRVAARVAITPRGTVTA
ncbi:hypothetical protein [Microbacterium sp. CJ88]|uniref:hypothetical protein n=1 Tax=Microbacterium sp. CJ88 TaxID=3445672 RepID=UPI003F65CBFF